MTRAGGAMTAAIVALGACTMPGQQGGGVREATMAEVATCRYVTDITMTPGVYGPVITDQAMTLARARVRSDAAAAGADTVVFAAAPGAQVYLVEAKAYRCQA